MVTISDDEDDFFQTLYTHHFIPDGPPAPFSEDYFAETGIPESAEDVAEISSGPIANHKAVAKSFNERRSVNLSTPRNINLCA